MGKGGDFPPLRVDPYLITYEPLFTVSPPTPHPTPAARERVNLANTWPVNLAKRPNKSIWRFFSEGCQSGDTAKAVKLTNLLKGLSKMEVQRERLHFFVFLLRRKGYK